MTWTFVIDTAPRVVALGTPGPTEILFILILIFILFGAKKIPEIMRSLGRAQGEYLQAKKEFEREVKGREGGEDPMEDMRRKAKELGIDTKGKDFDQLQREVALEGGDTRKGADEGAPQRP